MYENADRSHTFLSEECIKCPVRQTSRGGSETKKSKICRVQLFFPLLWQTHSPLSSSLGDTWSVLGSPPPLLSPSRCLTHPLPHTPHPPTPPVWVTPGWVSGLWSWDGFFLPTRALPDNAAQPDTNVIKNEKQLVRVAASVDMKWKVEERRDGRLTVQSERLKKNVGSCVSCWRARGLRLCRRKPNRCFLFSFTPLLHLFVLFLVLFFMPAWKKNLIRCGPVLDNLSCGCVSLFLFFFDVLRKNEHFFEAKNKNKKYRSKRKSLRDTICSQASLTK